MLIATSCLPPGALRRLPWSSLLTAIKAAGGVCYSPEGGLRLCKAAHGSRLFQAVS